MYDYEDYENDIARQEYLREREAYEEERADLEWYDRRYEDCD